jgi:hypothetical protein
MPGAFFEVLSDCVELIVCTCLDLGRMKQSLLWTIQTIRQLFDRHEGADVVCHFVSDSATKSKLGKFPTKRVIVWPMFTIPGS